MSDEALRALERSASASGDSESWKSYYRERARIHGPLPSGESAWRIEMPEGAIPYQLGFGFAHPKDVVDVEAVHEEWRRCGTGLAVRIFPENSSYSLLQVPWQDATMFRQPSGRQGLDLFRVQESVGNRFDVRAPEFLGPPYAFGFVPNPGVFVPATVVADDRADDRLVVNPGAARRRAVWVQGLPLQGRGREDHQVPPAAPL